MARPQVEDGFAMLALELLAAFSVSDFNKHETMIIALLFAAQYGPEKSSGLAMDAVQLGLASFSDPSRFRRAFKSLKADSVIVEKSPNFYSFSKDWERWLKKAGGRLDGGDRSFVTFFMDRFASRGAKTHKRKSRATEPENSSTFRATEPENTASYRAERPGMIVDAFDPDLAASLDVPTESVAGLACVGAPASEDQNIREKKKDSGLSTDPHLRADGSRPKTVQDLEDWVAEFTDPNQYVHFGLAGWVKAYGVSDTFDALMTALTNARGPIRSYVDATLRNWNAEGKLPSLLAAKAESQARTEAPPTLKLVPKPHNVSAFLDSQAEAIKARRARKDAENVQGA